MLSGWRDSAILIIYLKRSHPVKEGERLHVIRPQHSRVASFSKLHPTDKTAVLEKGATEIAQK